MSCCILCSCCMVGWDCAPVGDAERCPSWPKEHDWKSCIRQKRIWGSNPHLSATERQARHRPYGRVAERLNAAVSKTVSPVTPVTRVRIPALPPVDRKRLRLTAEALFLYPELDHGVGGSQDAKRGSALIVHWRYSTAVWSSPRAASDSRLSGLDGKRSRLRRGCRRAPDRLRCEGAE